MFIHLLQHKNVKVFLGLRPRIGERFFLFYCLAIFQLTGLFGQTRSFEHFSVDNFPHGSITAFCQDQLGFLWIGTSDGLGRYDGTQLIEYRYLPRDTHSISNNYIQALHEAKDGSLWVGTRQGLSVYRPEKDQFERIRANINRDKKQADIVLAIHEDSQGFIWYGTYHGLFRLDPRTLYREQVLPNEKYAAQITSPVVWKIHEDRQGRIWVGSGMGLLVSKPDDKLQFDIYANLLEDKLRQVWSIVEQANGTLWLGTNNGVYQAVEGTGGFWFNRYFETQLSDNFIQNLRVEGDSLLWVGTWKGGLHEIDLRTHKLIHYQHSDNDKSSISLNKITTVERDRSGLLWVGTVGGLDKTSDKQEKFTIHQHEANNANSLSNDIIKSVHKDQEGNLWVGTYNGLNFLAAEDLKKGNFHFKNFHHDPGNPQSISANNIFGLAEDSQGLLWIATHNGLNYVELSTFAQAPIFHHLSINDGLPSNYIYEVKEIQNGEYWIGTATKMAKMYFNVDHREDIRFNWYDREQEKEGAIVNSMVYTFTKDRHQKWWMGTFDGIGQHYTREGNDFFTNYQHQSSNNESLSNNSIRCFFHDSQDRTWIGTRAGLNLVQQDNLDERARFISFGVEAGFTNDVINFVVEDAQQQLWVGTQEGLVHFDPAAALAGQDGVNRVYGMNDGLASANTVFRAAFQDEDGTIYFGTAKGLHVFHPAVLPTNTTIPPLVFTKLEVLNEPIHPAKSGGIMEKSIHLTESITLNHRQNVFSIGFSALEYTAPEQNRYRYRLLGFTDKWVETRIPSVTYTNLSAGTYHLQVMASNNDGLWNPEPIELTIRVNPPFWRTTWAYLIYGALFIGLIYLIIRQRVNARTKMLAQTLAIQQARHEERELLRQKNAADFHDELGHRLTKISLFLALAEQESTPSEIGKTYLKKIKSQAEGLSSGMRDLIWTLDPQQDNFLQTLIRLRDFGDKLFEHSSVHFQLEGKLTDLEKVQLKPDDRKNLLLLFKEAMHNCLKYAQAEQAQLIIQREPKGFSLEFRDDGQGIDHANKGLGYGLKNMETRAKKLGSQLIITSEVGKGTSIRLDHIPHMG